MSGSTLVSTGELEKNLAHWRVFDCRHDLAQPALGEQQYRASHIPGALFAHLDRDLSGKKNGRNGRHPLPEPGEFEKWLETTGLAPKDQVVCYDGANGSMAARLWWMLRWIGHDDVAVLDGGKAAWVAAGGALEPGVPPIDTAATPYPLGAASMPTLQADQLLGTTAPTIVDARSAERFRGEVEPLDPVAGHIPGARNRFHKDNLGADGRFKSAAELRAAFEGLHADPARVVHQCGSGVTACHNLLAMEHAGLKGSALYPGSWSEWVADPSRPVATGN